MLTSHFLLVSSYFLGITSSCTPRTTDNCTAKYHLGSHPACISALEENPEHLLFQGGRDAVIQITEGTSLSPFLCTTRNPSCGKLKFWEKLVLLWGIVCNTNEKLRSREKSRLQHWRNICYSRMHSWGGNYQKKTRQKDSLKRNRKEGQSKG